MTQISTIGLDIAKLSFAVHGFDAEGKTVLKKGLNRSQVLPFFARLETCRVGLEACASAHHWARELAKLGHEVKLIPAQRVKAFCPRQKNDAADAQAIARAVGAGDAVCCGEDGRAAKRPDAVQVARPADRPAHPAA